MLGKKFLRRKRPGAALIFALASIVLTLSISGCATKPKTVIMAWPSYFELPKGTDIQTISIDGATVTGVKTQADMFCYDAQAQGDVLAAKKGVK